MERRLPCTMRVPIEKIDYLRSSIDAALSALLPIQVQ